MAKKQEQTNEAPQGVGIEIRIIPVANIHPSDKNPRSNMEADITELAESIKQYGILQPVTVRPIPDVPDDKLNPVYEMVCGHRRLKASEMLGLETIPAIIRELTDDEAFDMMITENLQRKDIEPLDEAVAYKALMDHNGVTIADLCARFGKSEKYIRGRVSLNSLLDDMKKAFTAGQIPLSSAIMLSRLTPQEQSDFYEQNIEEYLATGAQPDTTISDVKNFIEYNACALTNASFLKCAGRDTEEKWNTNHEPRMCDKCPHNTRSQYSLFPEMENDAAMCMHAECFHDKCIRFAKWFIHFNAGNLARKDDDLSVGSWYVLIDDSHYRNTIPEGFLDDLGEFKIVNQYTLSEVYERDEEKLKKLIDDEKVVKGLYIGALCAGHDPWCWLYKPSAGQERSADDEKYKLRNSLLSLKRQKETFQSDALKESFKDVIENLRKSENRQEAQPYELPLIIWLAMFRDRWPEDYADVDKNSPRAVREWLESHEDNPYDLVRAYYLQKVPGLWESHQIAEIMEAIDPAYVEVVAKDAHDKFDADIEHVVNELAKLGYDENLKPLAKEETES